MSGTCNRASRTQPGLKAFRLFVEMLALLIAGTLAVSGAELSFDGWVDAFSAEWVRGDPEMATAAQYFEGAEQDAFDRQLTPITKEFRAARVALARRGLAQLEKFKRAELSASQRI